MPSCVVVVPRSPDSAPLTLITVSAQASTTEDRDRSGALSSAVGCFRARGKFTYLHYFTVCCGLCLSLEATPTRNHRTSRRAAPGLLTRLGGPLVGLPLALHLQLARREAKSFNTHGAVGAAHGRTQISHRRVTSREAYALHVHTAARCTYLSCADTRDKNAGATPSPTQKPETLYP